MNPACAGDRVPSVGVRTSIGAVLSWGDRSTSSLATMVTRRSIAGTRSSQAAIEAGVVIRDISGPVLVQALLPVGPALLFRIRPGEKDVAPVRNSSMTTGTCTPAEVDPIS